MNAINYREFIKGQRWCPWPNNSKPTEISLCKIASSFVATTSRVLPIAFLTVYRWLSCKFNEIFDLFDYKKQGRIIAQDIGTIMSSLQRDPSELHEFVNTIDQY